MKIAGFSTLGILLSLCFFVGEASACTCGEMTVPEYRDSAKSVFLGKVISKKRSDVVEKDGVEVVLEVQKVWKGRVQKRTIVFTGATQDLYPFLNLCATPFRVGEKYIVFAYGAEKLSTDVCSGTGDFPYAKGVMKQLGQGKAPARS